MQHIRKRSLSLPFLFSLKRYYAFFFLPNLEAKITSIATKLIITKAARKIHLELLLVVIPVAPNTGATTNFSSVAAFSLAIEETLLILAVD